MAEDHHNEPHSSAPERRRPFTQLIQKIGAKEARKLKARRGKNQVLRYGFGMFGLVGWSIAIPTLLGVALGIWIDQRWPSRFSWTLMLLFAGVILGCLNAWYWVNQESKDE